MHKYEFDYDKLINYAVWICLIIIVVGTLGVKGATVLSFVDGLNIPHLLGADENGKAKQSSDLTDIGEEALYERILIMLSEDTGVKVDDIEKEISDIDRQDAKILARRYVSFEFNYSVDTLMDEGYSFEEGAYKLMTNADAKRAVDLYNKYYNKLTKE